MRMHTAVSVLALAISLPMQLQAQRRMAGAARPMIPHEPMRRAVAHAAPLVEAGRPPGTVPYVRDGVWYGHAAPDDPRFRLAHPFQFGRFALTGPSHVFTIARVELGARRVWLPGGGFEIAAWDWPVTAPWCWTCDEFVVYADPDHPGWYLLYDTRLGEYVHATFLGP